MHGQGKVWVYGCDCASPAEVDKATALIRQDAGVPDVIVNNAGTCLVPVDQSQANLNL